jgi:hypothetical protein
VFVLDSMQVIILDSQYTTAYLSLESFSLSDDDGAIPIPVEPTANTPYWFESKVRKYRETEGYLFVIRYIGPGLRLELYEELISFYFHKV